MGRVWLARDTVFGRDVALKEIRPERAAEPASQMRFIREAQITGLLEHPGVVPVYDMDRRTSEGTAFYTMRFVGGRTLTRAVEDYHRRRESGEDVSLDLSALLHAFVVVCNTLGYAHARGVIHRDLKGGNVVLGDFGEVVVLDWGLAKLLGSGAEQSTTGVNSDEAAGPELTLLGEVLGTPAYMAPEQVEGLSERIDVRTDIYGLGAILYHILTGRPPFTGAGTAEILRRVREDEPTPPRQLCPDIAAGLDAICLRALAKKPEHRYAAAKELADAVQLWQEAERRKAEEALRASELQYRSLADLIPGVVWTAQADGSIDYANRYWFTFSGMTWEQTQGNGWAACLHPDDLPRTIQSWTTALQTGEPYEIEYRLKRAADGAYRWFLAQARPLRNAEGQVVKWFGMLTEIEDRVHARKRVEPT
jgi:PAS domain S-box-containing protein